MLTKIEIHGFKSFYHFSLREPFQVIVGPNATIFKTISAYSVEVNLFLGCLFLYLLYNINHSSIIGCGISSGIFILFHFILY